MLRRRGSAALLLLLTTLLGCGSEFDLPPMQKVSGIVTLDGAPVTRGNVQFQPDAAQGAKGPPANGAIGPDGHYELTTAGSPGAVVGKHQVLVEARALPKDETDTLPAPLVPEKYFSFSTSGITKEVTAAAPNEINIELSSKP
jgi:hypothetical protein